MSLDLSAGKHTDPKASPCSVHIQAIDSDPDRVSQVIGEAKPNLGGIAGVVDHHAWKTLSDFTAPMRFLNEDVNMGVRASREFD